MPARRLDSSVQYVKGVGERLAGILGKLNIFTVRDLIYHFPHRHEDWTNFVRISELRDGMTATIRASVVGADVKAARGSGLAVTKVVVEDSSGTCTLVFFGNRFLKDKFMKLRGRPIVAFGTAQSSGWGIDIRSPEWEEFKPGDKDKGLVPVYPLTEGIMQGRMRLIVGNALSSHLDIIEDTLPENLRRKHSLMELQRAISSVHFPESTQDFNDGRRRLVFEELFTIQLALAMRKRLYDRPGCGIAFKVRPEFREGTAFGAAI
jgi:ATP-dependent DNA helicase RecG